MVAVVRSVMAATPPLYLSKVQTSPGSAVCTTCPPPLGDGDSPADGDCATAAVATIRAPAAAIPMAAVESRRAPRCVLMDRLPPLRTRRYGSLGWPLSGLG